MKSGAVKPWHIIIFALAAVALLWRVTAYTIEKRNYKVKMVEGKERNLARPGSKTYQMFEEK
ncbi:MAG: hypothetical protein HUU17_03295 [Chthonomonadales bacterium]|nr:hypothetical protein [Chthonomonadales bacterium]